MNASIEEESTTEMSIWIKTVETIDMHFAITKL